MTYQYDANARYAKSDEWARLDGDVVVVGVSDYAQDQLSDVVYVELPEVGRKIQAGQTVAVVESVKAAADILAPVSGEIVEVNQTVVDTPELVNSDPFGEAWLFKLSPSDTSELEGLMDADAYAAYNDSRET